ncbi:hypothetical protein MJM43_30245, partial [Salmonella enterica subsp. enterica serovar Montevideo]|nr:hypothetical protein [Salmonella enterica subsp. enterica serovar Montevideo]
TLGNIAPLSLTPFRPGRMALVCEGGGQRGIFTAGVLDEFMRASRRSSTGIGSPKLKASAVTPAFLGTVASVGVELVKASSSLIK